MSRAKRFKNIVLFSRDIDEVLGDLKQLYELQEQENIRLEKENDSLKDEHYKDKELQAMEQECNHHFEMKKQAQRLLYQGFPISDSQKEKISSWQQEHEEKEHPGVSHGASGGGYTYRFYPTSIGTAGECVCNICQSNAKALAFRVLRDSIRNKKPYIRDDFNTTEKEHMRKHNGILEFQTIE